MKDYPILKYKLDGTQPVPVEDVFEWGEWLEGADRSVCQTRIGRWFVSTVFLGIDHNFHMPFAPDGSPVDHRPVLFETMVFTAVDHPRVKFSTRIPCLFNFQERYHTWTEAEQGHQKVCDFVREHGTGARGTFNLLWFWIRKLVFGREECLTL